MTRFGIVAALVLLLPSAAAAADYPTPKSGDWIAPNFKFHTGEVMSQLKLKKDLAKDVKVAAKG